MASIITGTVDSDRLSIAVRTAGTPDRPAFILLHGWPQCGSAFDTVLERLGDDFVRPPRTFPVSAAAWRSRQWREGSDRTAYRAGDRCAWRVGQDVGGMVAFACFRQFGERLDGGVIVNTVIPGIYLGTSCSQIRASGTSPFTPSRICPRRW